MNKQEAKDLAAQFMSDPALVREYLRQNDLTYGALIAVGVIFVQPFLGVPPSDEAGLVSVIAFAVAIPLLSALVVLNRQETFRGRMARSRSVEVVRALGQLASFVGVVAGFWHITPMAGVAAIVAAVIGTGVHSIGFMNVETRR